jgi:HAD superfamily hydrolase (TIGR01549 family)
MGWPADDGVDTAIFDVDGTLVDTNYQHALAWFRAFRRVGVVLPLWRIHRHIGMGGDQIVAALAGDDVEKAHGEELRSAWKEEFAPFLAEVQPFAAAHEVLADVRRRGFRVVLASSGAPDHVDHYLDLIDGRSVAEAWTTSADVERTKPEPDLVQVAVQRVHGSHPVMIGDSTWDCIAAKRAGVPSLAVRTGGFSVDELTDAGALRVFESLEELRSHLDDTPLAAPR